MGTTLLYRRMRISEPQRERNGFALSTSVAPMATCLKSRTPWWQLRSKRVLSGVRVSAFRMTLSLIVSLTRSVEVYV